MNKRFVIPAGILLALALFFNVAATPALATTHKISHPVVLSNNHYYINSTGQSVHSPAHASSIPAGATAQCRDGSYSFSRHRSGTCSGHHGVARWL